MARRRMHAGHHRRDAPEGAKELVGFQVGVRESAQSWRELLIEVKRRGLEERQVLGAAYGVSQGCEDCFEKLSLAVSVHAVRPLALLAQPHVSRPLARLRQCE